ncbi:MAG: kynureninase, partial [Paracoccaceae bacterium]|nr:kynureninase [Paracoccaceae bacterium]
MPDLPSREDAIALDRADPFAAKRDAFLLEDGVIYLCGNSLGPMPKNLLTDMDVTLREDWAKGLITSQNKAGWFMMTDTLGDRLGVMLGADDGEIVVSDATGLNIYKTLHAAISMQPGRKSIVCETASFPTDLY